MGHRDLELCCTKRTFLIMIHRRLSEMYDENHWKAESVIPRSLSILFCSFLWLIETKATDRSNKTRADIFPCQWAAVSQKTHLEVLSSYYNLVYNLIDVSREDSLHPNIEILNILVK